MRRYDNTFQKYNLIIENFYFPILLLFLIKLQCKYVHAKKLNNLTSDSNMGEQFNFNQLQNQRNTNVDLVRTIACFGVVAIHVHSTTKAAEGLGHFFLQFCVPFFYLTAITYFVSSLGGNVSIKKFAKKTWKRLGLPFLTWSCIYVILLYIKSRVTGNGHVPNIPQVFLYGSSAEKMYYLPQLITLQAITLSVYLLCLIKSIINAFAYSYSLSITLLGGIFLAILALHQLHTL